MTFSLINVQSENPDGTVNGSWVQDCIGTLDDAVARAERTSAANSGSDIAVVRSLRCPNPGAGHWHNRVRLTGGGS